METLENTFTAWPLRAFETFDSTENSDWGYARTKRCILMTPSAEWGQSIYSCQFDFSGQRLMVPNRDYPYEGLEVYSDGENWKYIDCFALGVRSGSGEYLPFKGQSQVLANPWQISYRYEVYRPGPPRSSNDGRTIPFYLTYYLCNNNTPDLAVGCIELYFPKGLIFDNTLLIPVIKPFIDIRHMYHNSRYSLYRYEEYSRGACREVQVSSHNRTLTVYIPEGDVIRHHNPQIIAWDYKLGAGSREERINRHNHLKEIHFAAMTKEVASFFDVSIPPHAPGEKKFTRIYFACGLENHSPALHLCGIIKRIRKSRKTDESFYRSISASFRFPGCEDSRVKQSLHARIAGLTKFKTIICGHGERRGTNVPNAGAWWFRTPWYRDVFEGLLNSFQTLIRIRPEQEEIKHIVLQALGQQEESTGRILNKIIEYKGAPPTYFNSDATLLCYIVANAYIERTKDRDFALEIIKYAEKTIRAFQRNADLTAGARGLNVDGPPGIHRETGLLLSVPWHSWIDTRTKRFSHDTFHAHGLPSRLSDRFIAKLFQMLDKKNHLGVLLNSPVFFLPEINAQWLTLLKGLIDTVDFLSGGGEDTDAFRSLVSRLFSLGKGHFKKMFWNKQPGFLFNAVYTDTDRNLELKDELDCETAVTAAAMLGQDFFTTGELKSIWHRTRDTLLIFRRMVTFGDSWSPFGILTKNESHGIFYDDPQYHGDVVWLRSTPYLVKLLDMLGEKKMVEEILMNTLDHQMSEAAIFYNQELFSRPSGINPSPDERTFRNPVPVKNPVQFWSQWCDAYLAFFDKVL